MDTYRRKSDMIKMAPKELQIGDIVMVEFFVTRWIPKEEDDDAAPVAGPSNRKSRSATKGNNQRGKKEWKAWNVEFRLDAISLIYPGHEYHDEQIKADENVEL